MRSRLAFTWECNVLDITATLVLMGRGFIESNPVMAWLLQWPLFFVIVKLAVMTLVLLRLWHCRRSPYAQAASWVAAVMYGTVASYYVLLFALVV